MEQHHIPGMPDPPSQAADEKKPARSVTPPRRTSPTRSAAVGDPNSWAITDHVCRVCFGRVLARETFDHRRIYRCSNCGVEREGKSELAICCCGIKLKTGVDAGIRCAINPQPTPELPSEVIAEQVSIQK